jgi:hypothetical protein
MVPDPGPRLREKFVPVPRFVKWRVLKGSLAQRVITDITKVIIDTADIIIVRSSWTPGASHSSRPSWTPWISDIKAIMDTTNLTGVKDITDIGHV